MYVCAYCLSVCVCVCVCVKKRLQWEKKQPAISAESRNTCNCTPSYKIQLRHQDYFYPRYILYVNLIRIIFHSFSKVTYAQTIAFFPHTQDPLQNQTCTPLSAVIIPTDRHWYCSDHSGIPRIEREREGSESFGGTRTHWITQITLYPRDDTIKHTLRDTEILLVRFSIHYDDECHLQWRYLEGHWYRYWCIWKSLI